MNPRFKAMLVLSSFICLLAPGTQAFANEKPGEMDVDAGHKVADERAKRPTESQVAAPKSDSASSADAISAKLVPEKAKLEKMVADLENKLDSKIERATAYIEDEKKKEQYIELMKKDRGPEDQKKFEKYLERKRIVIGQDPKTEKLKELIGRLKAEIEKLK